MQSYCISISMFAETIILVYEICRKIYVEIFEKTKREFDNT